MKFWVLSFIFFVTASAIYSNELKKYEFTYQDEDLIMAFVFDEEPQTEVFNLKNPFRLIMTLKDTSLNPSVKKKDEVDNEIIKSIMTVQYARNGKKNTKVILNLKREVAYTVDKFNNRVLIILKNVKTPNENFVREERDIKEDKKGKPSSSIEKTKNILKEITYRYIDDDLVISLKTDRKVDYKVFELVNPFRVFLDLNDVRLSEKFLKRKSYNDKFLKEYIINQMARNGKNKVRVTFFFKDKKVYTVEQFNSNIVITLKGVKQKFNTENYTVTKEVPEEKVEKVILKNMLTEIKYQYFDEDLVISLKTGREVNFKSYDLANPFRIFLDLDNIEVSGKIKKQKMYKDEFLKKHFITEMSRNGKKKLRITFFFKDKRVYGIEKFKNNVIITIKGAKTPILARNQINEKVKVEDGGLSVKVKKGISVGFGSGGLKVKVNPEEFKSNLLRKISYQYIDEDLVISLKTDKEIKFKSFDLSGPFRIFLDLKGVKLPKDLEPKKDYDDEFLKKYIANKILRNGKETLRLTFFFKDKRVYGIEKFKNNIVITVKGAKILNNGNNQNTVKEDYTEEKEEIKKENSLPVEYNYGDNSLLIAIKLKNDENINYYHLTDPFRIIIDVKKLVFFNERMKELKYDDGFLKNIKFIKYEKNGVSNSKVILSFKEYTPYEVDKINNTILITLSNVVNVPENRTESSVIKPKEKKEVLRKDKELSKDSINSVNSDNKLIKIIFKKYGKKGRVVIKTQNKAVYNMELSGNVFLLTLENTDFESRMASLTLNTEFFKTAVKKISPLRKENNIVIRIDLTKSINPDIKKKADKLILDF